MKLSYYYSLLDRNEEAISIIDKGLTIDMQNHRLFFLKGLIYSQMEKLIEAELALKNSMSLNTNSAVHFHLGTVYDRMNLFEKAENELQKCIELDSNDARALNYLGYLYAEKNIKLDKSIELTKKALELDPDNSAYLDTIGWAHYKKGNYDKAIHYIEAALKANRKRNIITDPIILEHLGDAYLKNGNIKKAIFLWEKAYETTKKNELKSKIDSIKNTVPE